MKFFCENRDSIFYLLDQKLNKKIAKIAKATSYRISVTEQESANGKLCSRNKTFLFTYVFKIHKIFKHDSVHLE